ncbi:clavesin-2-like isoform X1 [Cimex lectularius]|uniref:CRAL-TRIO domain-containing protein n=1 Tax=Cimex lectularius TaxID=79782 RepID=A0A8I6SUF3_CIMLE|nr:clavesin-2-like isoform X1 [Cimex lectularius]
MEEFSSSVYGLKGTIHKHDMEIGSNPSLPKILSKDEALKTLKSIVESGENKDITRKDDDFLLRFLHARKLNVEESYQLLSNYFSYRKRNRELFDNISKEDPLIKQALYDGFPGVLSNRDRRGRCVLVFFCNNWDQENYPLDVIYRSILLSLEILIVDIENQLNGFVIIVDWTNMSFRQFYLLKITNLTPKTLKLMIEGLQDCFPAKFKGIHFINQPWYVEPIIAIIRAFLKEKTKKKIFVHGNNMSTLHEHVNINILPAELGGEGPPHSPTNWANYVVESK